MMNFTYDKFQTKVDDLVDTIAKSGYSPTVVVGVQRGGLVPATYLSHKLGVPLQVLDLEVGFKEKHNLDYSAILLVDDICDTGQTLLKAIEQLEDYEVKTAVLVYCDGASFIPEYITYLHTTKQWVVFPWETVDSPQVKTTEIKAMAA